MCSITACTPLENSRRESSSADSVSIDSGTRHADNANQDSINISPAITKNIIQFGDSEKEIITTYTIKKDTLNFAIRENTANPKTIRGWHIQDEKNAEIIINGTFFDENYNATGKLVIEGENKGTNGYDADKSALISIGNNISVKRKSKIIVDKPALYEADTFPVLIENGTSQIKEQSTKTARRSFIGNDTSGNTIIGISDSPLSLFDLTQHLEQSDIQFTTVANLDGGPSSGISIKAGNTNESINSFSSIPNVIIGFQP